MKNRLTRRENHELEAVEDAWLEEKLAPLRELAPPAQLRLANRRRILAAAAQTARLGLNDGKPWWRWRIVIPVPAALAMAVGLAGFIAWLWPASPHPGKPPRAMPASQSHSPPVAPLADQLPAGSTGPTTDTLGMPDRR